MFLKYTNYELPVLEALEKLGGEAKVRDVYSVVEEIMKETLSKYPEEYGKYPKYGDLIWKNRTQWAREFLKRKGQLDGSEYGVWKITESGKERLRLWRINGKDPDAGLETVVGVPEEEEGEEPEKVFEALQHMHGPILGVKEIPIVYEPINEQGVILLFTTLAARLNYLIVAIRPQFPDAQLARRDENEKYKDIRAEFEFKSSQFKLHGHNLNQCDLIICWEHDWKESPIEVLELQSEVNKLRKL